MGKYDKKPARGGSSPRSAANPAAENLRATNPELQRVAHWLSTVRFRKNFFGGVREDDLWKKLDELNRLYEDALVAERARYDMLLRMDRMNRTMDAIEADHFEEDFNPERDFDG